jgi:hypothetical protein
LGKSFLFNGYNEIVTDDSLVAILAHSLLVPEQTWYGVQDRHLPLLRFLHSILGGMVPTVRFVCLSEAYVLLTFEFFIFILLVFIVRSLPNSFGVLA